MEKIILSSQLEYLSSFRKQLDPLIEEMETYAKEHNVPILSWQSADFLEQLVLLKEPKRVLELGTAIAYSTIRIARMLQGKSVVHSIEKSVDNIAIAKDFIAKSGLGNKIKLLEGNAMNVMPQLKKKYDIVFLDADKEDYKRLFDYSLVLLRKGGVLVVDNLLWHGYAASVRVPQDYKESTRHIREFNLLFMNQPNLKSSIIPIGDGLGIGVKI
ncbi:MAG: O-methyltransferase [Ignavibacteriota bacterium]|jgi:predicted O-methyltransferase YrrM|nr:MAG: O-methyltransferase [Chlorobiota bacterium]MBE7476628.1 O-methyltransferase [Ignavibacteriales bacterium]MBL1122117.1 O-methyltransferase [Ignavibacteriota bacterium]MCC7094768.1 O-methyltransferase [Ignavibacteriaceae bacterium]MCE7857782.1 O-methyltransferase [Ignavibacteria bacterium CHB3]MEB2296395.1 O-methyltransferase [Ignavibacteria bacterium]